MSTITQLEQDKKILQEEDAKLSVQQDSLTIRRKFIAKRLKLVEQEMAELKSFEAQPDVSKGFENAAG